MTIKFKFKGWEAYCETIWLFKVCGILKRFLMKEIWIDS